MLIASCDIETTGLDEEWCQILEVAVVLWDTKDLTCPVEALPTFHTYVTHERVRGDAFALSMHGNLLRRIANRESGWDYSPPLDLPRKLKNWVQYIEPGLIDAEGRAKLCFTGKNFGSFDLQFLKKLEEWVTHIRVKHRVLDPGTLFFNPATDQDLPSMDECCKRAGLLGEFGNSLTTKHDAIGDARIVIQLLRAKYASFVDTRVGVPSR